MPYRCIEPRSKPLLECLYSIVYMANHATFHGTITQGISGNPNAQYWSKESGITMLVATQWASNDTKGSLWEWLDI